MQNFQISNRESSVIIALKYSFAFDVMESSNVVYFDQCLGAALLSKSSFSIFFVLKSCKRRKSKTIEANFCKNKCEFALIWLS